MASNVSNSSRDHKRTPALAGAGQHIWSFLASAVLTIIAFAAVGLGWFSSTVTLIAFLIILALVQAGVQLFIWMHLKEKGHSFPSMFLATGGLIAIITVVSLYIWVWWS